MSVPETQGHTVIQVTPEGENCILLYGGSNRCVTPRQIEDTLRQFGPGDYLVLQNEINLLPEIVDRAAERGMRIILNPSPFDSALREVDFQKLVPLSPLVGRDHPGWKGKRRFSGERAGPGTCPTGGSPCAGG